MAYTLYGVSGVGSRKNRITWMLEEIDADYEAVDTQPHSDIALSVNPAGILPALKVNDGVITDSAAIVTFLADSNPGAGMSFPSGTLERAEMDGWTFLATADIEGPLWTAVTQAMLPEQDRNTDLFQFASGKWEHAVKGFAKRLGEKKYVMGDQFTVPDLILGHLGFWAKHFDLTIPADNVNDYFDRILKRPAFRRAIEKDEFARTSKVLQ